MNMMIGMLQVIGSLGLFIYGMSVLSDGIQKAAGGQLRMTLRGLTKNPLSGILFGLVTTGLLQSSSAVTVMIVSFVNGGLITATQSIGLIMGANIGTTVTAWLVALGGFLFKLKVLILPMLAVSIPFYYRGGDKGRYWAEFIIGLGILLLGLDFLKSSLPTLQNEEVFRYIEQFMSLGYLSKAIFVLIGIVLTLIIQSSSATLTLTLALVYNQWISVEYAAYMIIGENIGTCITAEIASIIGNREARKSARIHTLFNVVGSIWIFFLTPALLAVIQDIIDMASGDSGAFGQSQYQMIGLAAFHTTFNIINTIALLPLSAPLANLAEWSLLKSKRSSEERSAAAMTSTIKVSELSPIEIQLEIGRMSKHVFSIFQKNRSLFKSIDETESKNLIKWILDQRHTVKEEKKGLDNSILKLSKRSISKSINENIISFLNINNDLMRIYELIRNLTYELKDKTNDNVWLTPIQRSTILEMYSHLEKTMSTLTYSLNKQNFNNRDLQEIVDTEAMINAIRDRAQEINEEMQDEFHFNIKGTLTYIKLVSILEKIGDQCHDIAEKVYHSS